MLLATVDTCFAGSKRCRTACLSLVSEYRTRLGRQISAIRLEDSELAYCTCTWGGNVEVGLHRKVLGKFLEKPEASVPVVKVAV